MDDAKQNHPRPRPIGRPFAPGRSGNPGGRVKHAAMAAYTGLVSAAEMIAADPSQSDAEKVVALLGLLRGGLALLKRNLRKQTPRKRGPNATPPTEIAA